MEGVVMDPAFWKGRRVFLTGHTGFKGGWLALWLQRLGAHVTGFSLDAPTQPSLFKVANVAAGMHGVHGDVRDLVALTAAIRISRPEVILHLAAQSLVRASYDDPVGTYATNVMGTLHVLQAARAVEGVRSIVVVTTDKCYENREWVWGYREQDPMGGFDPYSSSKGCAELVTASMRNSFFPPHAHDRHGVAIASARAGNVIGGGDWAADRLVPDMLRSLASGSVAMLRSPGAIRPWQHVLDPLAGYLQLAERLHVDGAACGEAWNFGPDESDAWPVQRLAERVVAAWGSGAACRAAEGSAGPHEAHWLKLDSSKARQRLGWRPRWHIEQAIDQTVAWARAHHGGMDMHRFTIGQIEEYLSCM
jgi:CDP-glucose 4,6-dehydratase